MSNSDPSPYEWPYECLKNPHIKKLIRDLEKLPEWLKEQERKYYQEQQFAKDVFEEAVTKSGMLQKLKRSAKY